MNSKVNILAKACDLANKRLLEAGMHVCRDGRKLVGEVDAYCKANDEYNAALKNLRDAVGIRAMCEFINDDNAKSAAEFFMDFPNE